jgi:glycerol-3-phosphate cytidylyltransferase
MRNDAFSPAAVELRAMALQGGLPQQHGLTLEPTVAITYGTYDLFHIGHVNLFRRIKERFDILVVAVSTDDFNTLKGKRSVVPFADRLEMVRACRYVDLAIAEQGWGQKESDIARYGADAMVMGSDWVGHFDTLKHLCEVVYLPRTEGVSSSDLKQHIKGASR